MADDTETSIEAGGDAPTPSLRGLLRDLYFGGDLRATRFQMVLLAFDLLTVTFFWSPPSALLRLDPCRRRGDRAGLALDFAARLYISPRPLQYLRQPMAMVDLIVLVSLLLPALAPNLGFLRLLRALRLIGSYNVLMALETEVPFVRRNLAIRAAVNLGVFVFVVSAVVYVQQRDDQSRHQRLPRRVLLHRRDAHHHRLRRHHAGGQVWAAARHAGHDLRHLPVLEPGRRAFRPKKVEHTCPRCALLEHDIDAVYCKACGQILQIPNPGD